MEARWELGRGLRNSHVQQMGQTDHVPGEKKRHCQKFCHQMKSCFAYQSNGQRQGVTIYTRTSELGDSTIHYQARNRKKLGEEKSLDM